MIPKNLFTIWIGDESKCPWDLINTWKEKHPEWDHWIAGNDLLRKFPWKNRSLINVYLREKRYPGVADVMRYELLYHYGGFCHPADSECLHPIDDLFSEQYDAYAVYENEKVRPGLVSPLYGCTQYNEFAKYLIDHLPARPPIRRGLSLPPWRVTGNLYMKKSIEIMNYPRLKIFPSHVFNPIHHTGETYKGSEKVYAVQKWGATTEAGMGIKTYEWKKPEEKKKPVILWLDDIRDPNEALWRIWMEKNLCNPNGKEVVWVKTYLEFCRWILANGVPDYVCFDHDLKLEHYEYVPEEEFQDTTHSETGYDCATFLWGYCQVNELKFPGFAIQSANPVGAKRIADFLFKRLNY
jgi:hypothetical protein